MPLAGVAIPSRVSAGAGQFEEALLFTHRGLSGPAVLQASSYWKEGEAISLNLDPDARLYDSLRTTRQHYGRKNLTTELSASSANAPDRVPQRRIGPDRQSCRSIGRQARRNLRTTCKIGKMTPNGTEGYRTAEVTLGGIDTQALSSKTMECSRVKGLYFIGEAVDVTGWLGGYNFQWAWSSAMAVARALPN